MTAWALSPLPGLEPFWLLGLTLALGLLWARVRRLQDEQHALGRKLDAIARDVAGARRDLAGVARAQQLDDLRRGLVADLRPLVRDAIALELAGHDRGGRHVGIEFAGQATVAGPVAGGDIGRVQQGGTPHDPDC